MNKDLITPEEAGKLLKITARWVRELVIRGLIQGQKVGRQWVVSRQSVLDYLEQKKKS